MGNKRKDEAAQEGDTTCVRRRMNQEKSEEAGDRLKTESTKLHQRGADTAPCKPHRDNRAYPWRGRVQTQGTVLCCLGPVSYL